MNEIISEGKRERQVAEVHAKSKVKLFQDALTYCQDYVQITDLKEFSKDFKAYVVKQLKNKCGDFFYESKMDK